MIQLRDVFFAYPRGAFHLYIPELSIDSGARVAVVGPGSSGKTTLLNLVAGLADPEAGSVKVGEAVVSELTEPARRRFRASAIGFVFQNRI